MIHLTSELTLGNMLTIATLIAGARTIALKLDRCQTLMVRYRHLLRSYHLRIESHHVQLLHVLDKLG